MKSIAQQLADFVTQVDYDDLPQAVAHEAKRVILDSMGCALSGMDTQKGSLAIKLSQRLGGPPEACIIGTQDRVSCAQAAFANGELINAMDFDAILFPTIHVTPFVLPAALAMAETLKSSGREVILATVLGHEISCRVASGMSGLRQFVTQGTDRGRTVWPPVHGYSANIFGSAVAAGRLLKLDSGRMSHALGIAGYNAPMQASAQWQHSGTDALIKYASTGWFAQAGVTAALLAEMDYTGDTTVLDGDHSFWRFAGSEKWRPEAVTRNLGQLWHLPNIRYKIYPCCGIIQGSLDCLIDIVQNNRLAAKEIERIQVQLDPLSEMPLWQNQNVNNEIQAQFGVAYLMAVAALGLSWGIEWQSPTTWQSPEVRELVEKVTFMTHPEYGTAALADRTIQMARIQVEARGQTYSQETTFARGSTTPAAARLSDKELETKFQHNASGRLPQDKINQAINIIWELDKQQGIYPLMATLTR